MSRSTSSSSSSLSCTYFHIALEDAFFGLDGHGGDVEFQFTADVQILWMTPTSSSPMIRKPVRKEISVLAHLFFTTVPVIARRAAFGQLVRWILSPFAGCYKPEYVVARDGFAICQGILDLIAAFAEDDELGIFLS